MSTHGTDASPEVDPASRLASWLAHELGATNIRVFGVVDGAIEQDLQLRVDADGKPHDLVLRGDNPANTGCRRPGEEFALLQIAYAAGIHVPEPIARCCDPHIVGRPFMVFRKVHGIGYGPRVVDDLSLGGDRKVLCRILGQELARIHKIVPPHDVLPFLRKPLSRPAEQEVRRMRLALDAIRATRPALEWGLRWAEVNSPDSDQVRLIHGDYHTGNYLLDERGLTAVFGWKEAGWGDPWADLGCFCAECWRFGRPDLEAGGVGSREEFYRGYELESGLKVDDDAVRYWEVIAHLRWAVLAAQLRGSPLAEGEPSLETALTGRVVPQLELAVLRATAPLTWRRSRALS